MLGVVFDRRYGIDTNKIVPVEDLNAPSRNLRHAVQYQPTTPGFRFILDEMSVDWRNFTFVDLGSGKGRVLIEVAAYPFEKIGGAEFSPKLHNIAQKNVRKYQEQTGLGQNIGLRCVDAADFQFGNGDIVLYLYNPFRMNTMVAVVDNLLSSMRRQDRKIVIIYLNPVCAELIDKAEFIQRRSSGTYGLNKYHVYDNLGP